MRGYIPGEDDLQGLLRYRSKYQSRGPRLDRRKRNLPDTYSRTYGCEKSLEGCNRCQHVAEARFSQDSALTYNFGSTKGATCTTVINSHSKASDVSLFPPTTSRSAISIFNEFVVYQKRSLQTQLRRFLAVLGQSAPAAEFRGQDLRTVCEEILLLKRFCDPRSTHIVDDFVYAPNHNLNHQCTAAIITKPHGGDVETGKST
ncbi:hypothetical protein ACTXT7_007213 [Hymenolepis weldensis]